MHFENRLLSTKLQQFRYFWCLMEEEIIRKNLENVLAIRLKNAHE